MKAFEKFSALPVAVGLGLSAPVAWAADTLKSALKAQAKIAETDARATALAKVPGGVVQSAEFENEHGKLVWSFDAAPSLAHGWHARECRLSRSLFDGLYCRSGSTAGPHECDCVTLNLSFDSADPTADARVRRDPANSGRTPTTPLRS